MGRYDNDTKILLSDLYITNVMGEQSDFAVSKQEFTAFLENEARLRIDDFIEGAIEIAEEVHSGVKREDRLSPFLETHTLPVTIDVVKHYRHINRSEERRVGKECRSRW